jgi:hypothetical protein
MGWVYRYVDQHKCEMPDVTVDSTVRPGDVWECSGEPDSCGQLYVVAEQQYDGKYFRQVTDDDHDAVFRQRAGRA